MADTERGYTHIPILDDPIGKSSRRWMGATGLTRDYWPKGLPTGWLPSMGVHGALGAGLGALLLAPVINRLMPGVFRPGRLRIGMGLLGGLGGAGLLLPGFLAAYEKGGLPATYSWTGEAYPWGKQARARDIPPIVEESLAPLFEKAAARLKRAGLPSLPAHDMPPIGISHTRAQIMSDMNMTPGEKVRALYHVDQAAGGDRSGLLANPGQKLFGSMLGAGLGYGTAALGGKVMGTVFGLQPKYQNTLSRVGAVAGLLRGAGVI